MGKSTQADKEKKTTIKNSHLVNFIKPPPLWTFKLIEYK
jgi:hypothetical protein